MQHDQLPVLSELIAVVLVLSMAINKKPRVGGRGGVSVLSVSLRSETPAVPAPPAAKQQQIYRQ
jgi:hypothetical protein